MQLLDMQSVSNHCNGKNLSQLVQGLSCVRQDGQLWRKLLPLEKMSTCRCAETLTHHTSYHDYTVERYGYSATQYDALTYCMTDTFLFTDFETVHFNVACITSGYYCFHQKFVLVIVFSFCWEMSCLVTMYCKYFKH